MSIVHIRPLTGADQAWVAQRMNEEWGSELIVVHGTVYKTTELPGFVAELDSEIIGLLTFHIEGQAYEIVTLNTWHKYLGAGSSLIEAAKESARLSGCKRLWLVTTNDNTQGLRFYQKHGFLLAAVHINAVEKDRQLKPEIPLTGFDGIPIRDEIELEIQL